jgi:type IV pilus biogenesis protein CpaD/CtpE
MKSVLFAAVSILFFCSAAAAQDQAWLSGLTDEELTAVDGSTLMLSQEEGHLALSIRMRSGSETNSTFNFINENLGTVTDEGDKGQVSALFRRTDIGLEILYGDGRSASLVANTQDGLTLTRRTPGGESGCMSWYPSGHVFSPDERRAAVAAYAESLGIQSGANASPQTATAPAGKKHKKAAPLPAAVHPASLQSPCAPALHAPKAPVTVRSATVHTIDNDAAPPLPPSAPVATKPVVTASVQPAPAAAPQPSAAPSSYRSIKLAFTNAQAGLAGPDAARLSIFVGEFLTASTSAMSIIPPNGAGPDVASFFRDRLTTLGVPADHIVIGARTAGDAEPRVELGYVGAAQQANAGASSCLGVETSGNDLGFRNRCAYGVQFAYCVIKSPDPSLACESGSKAGLVGAGGFTPVLPGGDTRIAAEHDIRWVACDTDMGKVVAHIDRADPPSGRCERVN